MKEVRMECLRTPYVISSNPLASMAWTHLRPRGPSRVRVDTSVLPPGNFVTDATMHPSHGRPSSHRLTVRPSVHYRPRDNPGFHMLLLHQRVQLHPPVLLSVYTMLNHHV
jgi:hypothetical protein